LPQFWDEGHDKFVPFKLDDRVLLKVQLPGDLVINKFKDRFQGPLTVLKVNPNNITYEIGNPSDEERIYKAHHRQLKKWIDPPTYVTDNPCWDQLLGSPSNQEVEIPLRVQRGTPPLGNPISTNEENVIKQSSLEPDSDDENDFEGFLPEPALTEISEILVKLRNLTRDRSIQQIPSQTFPDVTKMSGIEEGNITPVKIPENVISWNESNISRLFPISGSSSEKVSSFGYDSIYTEQIESDLTLNESPSDSICARYVEEGGVSRLQIQAVRSDLILSNSQNSSSSRESSWIRYSLLQDTQKTELRENMTRNEGQHEQLKEDEKRPDVSNSSSSFSFSGFDILCNSALQPFLAGIDGTSVPQISPIFPPLSVRPRTRASGPCEQYKHVMSTPIEYRRPQCVSSDLYSDTVKYIYNTNNHTDY
jgi:hypothetical protein